MARSQILSGERADGMQQRLRYGLGEFRPYRYKGKPGWNPAKVLTGRRGTRLSRRCEKCGAEPGSRCLGLTGKPLRDCHTGR